MWCLLVPVMGNSGSNAVAQRLEHASKTGVLSLRELKLEEVRRAGILLDLQCDSIFLGPPSNTQSQIKVEDS